jgi:hypothetical protein
MNTCTYNEFEIERRGEKRGAPDGRKKRSQQKKPVGTADYRFDLVGV